MRIAHRPHVADWFAVPVSDAVDPEYEAEVQRSTQRSEREYEQAEARLAAAEKRLAAATRQQAKSATRKRIAALREAVNQRRADLDAIRALMAAPVSADKQLRQRTGLDDHLELGEYQRAEPRSVPPGPVIRSSARKGAA